MEEFIWIQSETLEKWCLTWKTWTATNTSSALLEVSDSWVTNIGRKRKFMVCWHDFGCRSGKKKTIKKICTKICNCPISDWYWYQMIFKVRTSDSHQKWKYSIGTALTRWTVTGWRLVHSLSAGDIGGLHFEPTQGSKSDNSRVREQLPDRCSRFKETLDTNLVLVVLRLATTAK